jgi:hypothetical protein
MSKKNVPKKTSNKIFIIFFLAILAVVTLTGFIYYQSQRPNFRDLEAAFNELNIPSDWQQVSETKVTGYKGLFCFNVGIDTKCPDLAKTFTTSTKKTNYRNIVETVITPANQSKVVKNSCSNVLETCSVIYKTNTNVYVTVFLVAEDGIYSKVQILISDQDEFAG